jgi:hypothetical protein
MTNDAGLRFQWAPIYHPEWDADPAAYVRAEIVAWGRSRRLARSADPARHFKAYLGVQHFDPARWGVAGPATAKFFVSFFVAGRTVALHTYPTLPLALAALHAFHAHLAG